MVQHSSMIELIAAGPAGEVRALVSRTGAGLHGLSVGERAVMPRDTESSRERWFSGPTLAPWPNRIRDGVWECDGERLSAPANDGLGNALHGLVHDRKFDVVERTGDRIVLECRLGSDPVYPFAVLVRVTYAVDADGLTCTFAARNDGDRRAPFGVGTHPYFPFDDGTTVTINARRAFEVDDRLIPTGPLLDLSRWGVTPGSPKPLPELTADDCFTEHPRDADGRAHTVLTYADGWNTDVWQGEGMGYTVIFTARDFEWSDGTRNAIAIEPQTCPTNAFNSGTALIWLDPAGECAVQWGVTYRPADA